MIWQVIIEDAALNRLPPQDLKELIEKECDDLEQRIKRQVNAGRKSMGLEVMKDGDRGPTLESGSADQEV